MNLEVKCSTLIGVWLLCLGLEPRICRSQEAHHHKSPMPLSGCVWRTLRLDSLPNEPQDLIPHSLNDRQSEHYREFVRSAKTAVVRENDLNSTHWASRELLSITRPRFDLDKRRFRLRLISLCELLDSITLDETLTLTTSHPSTVYVNGRRVGESVLDQKRPQSYRLTFSPDQRLVLHESQIKSILIIFYAHLGEVKWKIFRDSPMLNSHLIQDTPLQVSDNTEEGDSPLADPCSFIDKNRDQCDFKKVNPWLSREWLLKKDRSKTGLIIDQHSLLCLPQDLVSDRELHNHFPTKDIIKRIQFSKDADFFEKGCVLSVHGKSILALNTRLIWRRPLWHLSWDHDGDLQQITIESGAIEKGSWEAEMGWSQYRSDDQDLGVTWGSSKINYQRGALSWSLFPNRESIQDFYQETLFETSHTALNRSAEELRIDSPLAAAHELSPLRLSPQWISIAHNAQQRIDKERPSGLAWNSKPAPEKAEDLRVWNEWLKDISRPQIIHYPRPLYSTFPMEPESKLLEIDRDPQRDLILWSPVRVKAKEPFIDHSTLPLRFWGYRRERDGALMSLADQVLPSKLDWLFIGSSAQPNVKWKPKAKISQNSNPLALKIKVKIDVDPDKTDELWTRWTLSPLHSAHQLNMMILGAPLQAPLKAHEFIKNNEERVIYSRYWSIPDQLLYFMDSDQVSTEPRWWSWESLNQAQAISLKAFRAWSTLTAQRAPQLRVSVERTQEGEDLVLSGRQSIYDPLAPLFFHKGLSEQMEAMMVERTVFIPEALFNRLCSFDKAREQVIIGEVEDPVSYQSKWSIDAHPRYMKHHTVLYLSKPSAQTGSTTLDQYRQQRFKLIIESEESLCFSQVRSR